MSTVVPRETQWEKSAYWLPHAVTATLFVALFADAMYRLGRDWVTDPEAGHGLLLAPIAVYMAWKSGLAPKRVAQPVLGAALIAMGMALRIVSGLAAEIFTMRISMWITAAGVIVCVWGARQILHWWLPAALLVLSVPLPNTIISSLALPLQLEASQMGASLLQWRQVPVSLSGNVIQIPGRSLFVTEACSGLRSLTALFAIGLLIGAGWFKSPWMRATLLAVTIPIAVVMNGIRVFLTGFLIYYVDPSLGDELMHYTEGWILFVVSFLTLGATAWAMARLQEQFIRVRTHLRGARTSELATVGD